MNSRDIVLQLTQEKAEDVLSVNLSTITFNDTIVFALEAENEFPEVAKPRPRRRGSQGRQEG